MSGEILPSCAVLPEAAAGSSGWPHAPSVGSARVNTGFQFSLGGESPGNKELAARPGGRASSPGYCGESDVGARPNQIEELPLMKNHGKQEPQRNKDREDAPNRGAHSAPSKSPRRRPAAHSGRASRPGYPIGPIFRIIHIRYPEGARISGKPDTKGALHSE